MEWRIRGRLLKKFEISNLKYWYFKKIHNPLLPKLCFKWTWTIKMSCICPFKWQVISPVLVLYKKYFLFFFVHSERWSASEGEVISAFPGLAWFWCIRRGGDCCFRGLTCLIPNQSARSRALASAVESPTTLTGFSVWDEIKFVRETITSRTGPRSSPKNSRRNILI